jgi:hypothetical protein
VRASINATLSDYYAAKIDNPNLEFTVHQENLMSAAEEMLNRPKNTYNIENPPRAPRKRPRRKRSV